MRTSFALSLLISWLSLTTSEDTLDGDSVLINEISASGTTGVCNGQDWIELYNPTDALISLSGYVLYDDKGLEHEESFYFPSDVMIEAQDYLLLCTRQSSSTSETLLSPQFGIGGDDTITLARLSTGTNAEVTRQAGGGAFDVTIVSSVGPLPNTNDNFDVTYARDPNDQQLFQYTNTPTPEAENIITELPTEEELIAQRKAELTEQNERGMRFFNMDNQGYPVQDGGPQVYDLRIYMDANDFETMMTNATHKMSYDYQSAKLTDFVSSWDDSQQQQPKEIWSRNTSGRIRPKGQYTLSMAHCMATRNIPFKIDFGSDNKDEHLFGVEEAYLRIHIGDASYMREWAVHRMAARWGLPHLRVTKVHFYINDQHLGFYSFMEAVEQEYVFHRSFPDYNPNDFALFKVKSHSKFCGNFPEADLAEAEILLEEHGNTDPNSDQVLDRPFIFDRNDEMEVPEQLGTVGFFDCMNNFVSHHFDEYIDVAAAWLHYDQDCGEMIVETGLIDEDLGDGYKSDMKDLINENLRWDNRCQESCVGSNWIDKVDEDQFLRTAAFYAALLLADSPRDTLNNCYLGFTGDGMGWKLIPYDMNAAGATTCAAPLCNERFLHWSITRPTCQSLEGNVLFGPLLTHEDLHAKYLEYTRQFVDEIMTDDSLLQQMYDHLDFIQGWVTNDVYSNGGIYIEEELSFDPDGWTTDGRVTFLPFLKARAADLQLQFQALDDGTFPRGRHVGVYGDYEPLEFCPDWRTIEADRSKCPHDCYYVGCHIDGYTIPSFCDEESGTCKHGTEDQSCWGVTDGEQYPGLEPFTSDGRWQYCKYAGGTPVVLADCPLPGEDPQLLTPAPITPVPVSAADADGSESGGSTCSMLMWVAPLAAMLSTSVALM